VNIHGVLKLETFDAPFVEPTTVDGASAAQLLARIEARNPDKRLIHTHNRHYPTQKQFANAILEFFRDKVSDNFRVMSHEGFRVLQ